MYFICYLPIIVECNIRYHISPAIYSGVLNSWFFNFVILIFYLVIWSWTAVHSLLWLTYLLFLLDFGRHKWYSRWKWPIWNARSHRGIKMISTLALTFYLLKATVVSPLLDSGYTKLWVQRFSNIIMTTFIYFPFYSWRGVLIHQLFWIICIDLLPCSPVLAATWWGE